MATTQNLHLPQFDGSDRIHHEDFNAAFETLDAAVASGVKIATGSYVGTGKCGNNHPNTLTFDFPPQIVIIKRKAMAQCPQFYSAQIRARKAISRRPAAVSLPSVQTAAVFPGFTTVGTGRAQAAAAAPRIQHGS